MFKIFKNGLDPEDSLSKIAILKNMEKSVKR